MGGESENRLVVPYGVAEWAPDTAGGGPGAAPSVEIDPRRATPLRLNNMSWRFPTPPDPLRIAATSERLDFLRTHLQSLCGLWDRLPRQFLDGYFAAIAATIEARRTELVAALGASGALFDVRDWSFSALCPLPQAHLPLSGQPNDPRCRVDFAFWTGSAMVAVELVGATTHSRARRASLHALRATGIEVIEIPGQALATEGAHGIIGTLGSVLDGFWHGERWPSSPFRPKALEIVEGGAGR